jgi:hypothetical protein
MKVSGKKISENRDAIPLFLGDYNLNMGFAKGISVRKSPPKGAGWKPW